MVWYVVLKIFKSLKSLWATAKNKWKETHLNENISKKSFPTLFKGAVDQITLSTVVNGFRKSGLYPLDPGKVDLLLHTLVVGDP